MAVGTERMLQGAGSTIEVVSISSDGKLVAAAAADDTVRVWRVSNSGFSQAYILQDKRISRLSVQLFQCCNGLLGLTEGGW